MNTNRICKTFLPVLLCRQCETCVVPVLESRNENIFSLSYCTIFIPFFLHLSKMHKNFIFPLSKVIFCHFSGGNGKFWLFLAARAVSAPITAVLPPDIRYVRHPFVGRSCNCWGRKILYRSSDCPLVICRIVCYTIDRTRHERNHCL